jgi:DNA-binding transcriptional LysR family regulator
MPLLSIDRVRVFVTVAAEGGFSAAAKKLNRSQSAVSHAIAEPEAEMGVALFDRSGWRPRLSPEGRTLLTDAELLVRQAEGLLSRARSFNEGMETELGIAVDSLMPQRLLAQAVARVTATYASTPIRIEVASMTGVARAVLEDRCEVALMASYPRAVPGLNRTLVGEVPLVPVVASSHPLAKAASPIEQNALRDYVQLVLTDPLGVAEGHSFGIQSGNIWRLADVSVKHHFLLSGFGWGNMPLDRVEDDLSRGTLVAIDLVKKLPNGGRLPIFAAYRSEEKLGKAGRAFISAIRDASGSTPVIPAA